MDTDILFADNLDGIVSGSIDRYCTHALCHAGEASFLMAGEWFRMKKGDCVIFTHNELISRIEMSDDFRITHLLSNKNLTLKEISDQMNFSSLSFFSRYVQRLLKVSPSEYRNSNLTT